MFIMISLVNYMGFFSLLQRIEESEPRLADIYGQMGIRFRDGSILCGALEFADVDDERARFAGPLCK